MAFDHRTELKKLKKRQEIEREILLCAGFSANVIDELHAFDIRQLGRERSFFAHLDAYTTFNEEMLVDEQEPDSELSWLEQIESPVLLKALTNLSPIELEIINLHVNQCIPLTFVAAILDKPYDMVRTKYYRSIKNIKKLFKK